jgi:uncharacterized Ntn-hydrolase superfamily protein
MSDLFCATFSIVAYDSDEKSWGVAVASKHIAIGAYVPYARSGIGAVATQSFTNLSFGPKGLELLSEDKSAKEVLEILLKTDQHPELRQIGIVDSKGNAASFTGEQCVVWAGEIIGKGYAIQGNMLAGESVLLDMENAFLSAEGELSEKLYSALAAGEKAGGDKRGKQSASLLVVKDTTFNGIQTDHYIDLRVDDHAHPVKELGRLLHLLSHS